MKRTFYVNTDSVDIDNRQIGIHVNQCVRREFCAGVSHLGSKESVKEATRIANLFAAAPEMLDSLLTARRLLNELAKGNLYLERGEIDKAICKALGLDYKTVKTEKFEEIIRQLTE